MLLIELLKTLLCTRSTSLAGIVANLLSNLAVVLLCATLDLCCNESGNCAYEHKEEQQQMALISTHAYSASKSCLIRYYCSRREYPRYQVLLVSEVSFMHNM